MPLKEAMFVYVSRHSSAPIVACGILCVCVCVCVCGEGGGGGGGEGIRGRVNLQGKELLMQYQLK